MVRASARARTEPALFMRVRVLPFSTQARFRPDPGRVRFYQNPARLEPDPTIGFCRTKTRVCMLFIYLSVCLHIDVFAYFCYELDCITVQFIC